MVDLANTRSTHLNNLYFVFCNANVNLENIYKSLPKVQSISILNPDPWFKKKHKKRRLINKLFVDDIYKYLSKDIIIYIQTDVNDLFEDITSCFSTDKFVLTITSKSILDIPSDREKAVLSRGGTIDRVVVNLI